MSAMDVGKRLVALCSEGKNSEVLDELYADDIVSVEAAAPPDGSGREMRGIDAIRGKNEWWYQNHEVHEAKVEGPFPHGDDRFAVIFDIDVTAKHMNDMRFRMREVAVYWVKDEKIVREEFFYAME